MGNVSAAGLNDASDVPLPPMSTQSSGSATPEPTLPAPETKEPSDNPGTYEDLHKSTRDVFPQIFEGAKLIINKGLSNHFQISHTLNMSNVQPSGYRFGATYVGTTQYGPSEAFPVLIGDIDPSGNLNANVIHQFTSSIRTKFITQIQNSKWVATQLSADYRGSDHTATVTLGQPDLANGSGVLVSQYLQKVTDNLDLGAELLYQKGNQVPGGHIAICSIGGRYTGKSWQLSGNISPNVGNIHACYWHKPNENLQIGVELDTSLRSQESVCTVGYQYDLPKANLVFRGQADTNWNVGAVLEKKLQPLPFTFVMSAYASHLKSAYRFGVGLMVG